MHIDRYDDAFSEIVKTKGKGGFNTEFRGISFDIYQDNDDRLLLHNTVNHIITNQKSMTTIKFDFFKKIVVLRSY
jgi:hypothetical protein